MDTIKSKGLSTLIKDGQFNFNGTDMEVANFLSDDLTLEEIVSSINYAEKILPKLPQAIAELSSLDDRYHLLAKQGRENETVNDDSIKIFGSILSVVGIIIVLIGFFSLSMLGLGIGILCGGIGLLMLLCSKASSSQNQLQEQKEIIENEEMKELQEKRKEICNQVGLIPESNYLVFEGIKLNTFWSCSAEKLSKRLPVLLSQLKKLKVIHEDKSLSSSAKMLAITQLFSLFNNEITNARVLKEKQRQSIAMEQQLKEMQKHSKELEAQNDILTLQTYNKVSEMEGHAPDIVAAQTYAQMSRIQKERNGGNE